MAGCGGAGGAAANSSEDPGDALARRIGGFSLTALAGDGAPTAWPAGLSVTTTELEGTATIVIEALDAAPDDLYLKVRYDAERVSFGELRLDEGRLEQYISLAVPHRVPGEVHLGLARIGEHRGAAAAPGPLFSVSFEDGADRTYRGVSTVNTDPGSATELFVESELGTSAVLRFEERNIGDYNNNSQVEIADITPVGLYFGQLVQSAPDKGRLALVDGDGNGEINTADLVPIGRNFNTQIDGFHVYRTDPPVAGAEPFMVLSRSDVFAAATADERKRRLVYLPEVELEVGDNTFHVAPFSSLEDPVEVGLPSNSVVATGSLLNQPPVWLTTVGVVTAEPAKGGIRLAFGAAEDPEGGAVQYVLNYSRNFDPAFGPGAESLVLPDPGGAPPYTYLFESDEHGTRFNFNLRARDPEGNSTTNSEVVSTEVPAVELPDDPWPGRHGPAMQTGTNVESAFVEPLEPDWQVGLPGSDAAEAEYSPVISKDGWAGVFDGTGSFRRYQLADGAFIAAHLPGAGAVTSAPALSGSTLAVGTATGLSVYNLDGLGAPAEYPSPAAVEAAPLPLGDYVYCCDTAGATYALIAATGEEVWRHVPDTPAPYHLGPASDGQSLFTANADGAVFRLDLLTGSEEAAGSIGGRPYGDAVVVSAARETVYLCTAAKLLIELAAADLALARDWDFPIPDSLPEAAPCIIEHADPPLAVVSYSRPVGPAAYGRLRAIDLFSDEVAWDTGLKPGEYAEPVVASADRIIAGRFSYDFFGSLRQALFADGTDQVHYALHGGGIITLANGTLSGWQLAAEDLPPQWAGDEGITGLDSGQYAVTSHWGYAENDHRMPVYYAVYIAAGAPPQFDPPYTGTTVFHSIPPEGEGVLGFEELHEYLVEGLTNGTRYYAGVRAYERPWYDNPRFEDNVNYLAVTPPWQREVLQAGEDIPWPGSGIGIFYMRGLVDPAGEIHLYYTDTKDGTPAHVWGGTGSWQGENADLGNYITPTFDLYWDGGLVAGWSYNSEVGLLRRNGVDDWTETVIPGTEATINPQLSFAINGEVRLAYTEHLFGTLPPTLASNYWYVETIGGEWQDPVVLDDQDESGRDLELELGGPGADEPWIAFQRGKDYATGRFAARHGQVLFARPDGGGGFDLELVDAGDNAPDSDCGKRLRQSLGGDGLPRLAYMDLDAAPDQPLGQLKFARYTGSGWDIDVVQTFDLSFQTGGEQFTWGELGLVLQAGDLPAIGILSRRTMSPSVDLPHLAAPAVWFGDGVDWRRELVWDGEWVLPRDREPCVLLQTPDGVLHLFYAMSLEEGPLGVVVDQLVHMYRPPDA